MNNLPSVCIMIPTYNQEAFIVKAVESALAQDYPDIEVVVADDASSDNTQEVLRNYIEEGKLIYKKNPSNLGRVANYKKCLYENTRASWVINLDGDDYYTNNSFISEAIKAICRVGESEVLFYQGAHIYKYNDKEEVPIATRNENLVILQASDYFFNIDLQMTFSHMSTLYNRNLAIESGFYELDILSTDIFSILKLCLNNKNKKAIISKTISGVWVQHTANTSRTSRAITHFKNADGYKKLYAIAVTKGLDLTKTKLWLKKYRRNYFFFYLGLLLGKFRKI
jgi:glycosyltransferase involved in cell wall biosynthesis